MSRYQFQNTKEPELVFRALLTQTGAELELAPVKTVVCPPIYKTSLAKVPRLLADVKGSVRFDVISPPPSRPLDRSKRTGRYNPQVRHNEATLVE